MKPKTFVVDRAKWRCGGDGDSKIGTGRTLLLNEDGCMCCLGFAVSQCGVDLDHLRGKGTPGAVSNFAGYENLLRPFAEERYTSTPLTEEAIDINDHDELTPGEREARLKELFAKHGHRIKFVGKYPKKAKVKA